MQQPEREGAVHVLKHVLVVELGEGGCTNKGVRDVRYHFNGYYSEISQRCNHISQVNQPTPTKDNCFELRLNSTGMALNCATQCKIVNSTAVHKLGQRVFVHVLARDA